MISINFQKTPMHTPRNYYEEGEELLSEIVDRYLGDLYHNSIVYVGSEFVAVEQYENTVIEDGDLVYLSVKPYAEGGAWAVAEVVMTVISFAAGIYGGYMAYKANGMENPVKDDEKEKRIDGLRNEPRKYEAIPVVLGEHRITPDWIAQPYSEVVGGDQYYNLLLCAGHGPLSLTDFRIGDTLVDEYEDVEVHVSDGFHDPEIVNDAIIYNGSDQLHNYWASDVSQENVNTELSYDDTVTRTTRINTTSLALDFYYSNGLFYSYENKILTGGVFLEVEIDDHSSGETYYLANVVRFNPNRSQSYSGYTGDVFYDYVNDNYYIADFGLPVGDTSFGGTRDVTSGNGYGSFSGGDIPTSSSFTSVGASNIKRYDRVNETISVINPPSDVYFTTVEKKTYDFYNAIQHSPYEVVSSGVQDIGSTYDVKVTQVNPTDHEGFENLTSGVLWLYLTAKNPISAEGFRELVAGGTNPPNHTGKNPIRPAVIAVRIRANNQLSGMLDKFNCKATSCVPDTWGAEWSTAYEDGVGFETTTNPPRLYRWLLQGPSNANPVTNDKVDLDSLSEWAQFVQDYNLNEVGNLETSGYLRQESTLLQELNKVAFTGRAEFSFIDGKYGVSVKEEKTTPVQMFTNKNSYNFNVSRQFPEDTDGIKFEFKNEDIDYEQDEGYYYNPDKSPSERRDLFDSVEIPYTSNPVTAQRHARFAYFENRLRRETYQLETDVEGLRCTRGDLVIIQNDIIDVSLGAGRVVSPLGGAGEFEIDEEINLVSGNTYAITRRSLDGSFVTTTADYIGNGVFNNVQAPVSFSNGDLVLYGDPAVENLECVVQEIDYGQDNNVTLTLVNHAPDLFNIDEDDLPEYETAITPRDSYRAPPKPVLSIPRNPERIRSGVSRIRVRSENGETNGLRFSLEARSSIAIDEEDPQISDKWEVVDVIDADKGYFDVETNLDNYWEFRAKTIGGNNLFSGYSNVLSVNIPQGPTSDVVSLALEELVDTPKTPNADISTIVARVDPPSEQDYDYTLIDYRVEDEFTWFNAGRTGNQYPNRVDIPVSSDGTSYVVRATTVSITGVVSESSVEQTITVYDVENDDTKPEITIPNVRGLEIFDQGNDNEFVGRDVEFNWRDTSINEWTPIGQESGQGVDYGGLDLYFRDYEIKVFDMSDNLLSTYYREDSSFTYTYELNRQDYKRVNGSEGGNRQFRIEVRIRGRNNQFSEKAARLFVENPAPALPAINSFAGFTALHFDYTAPQDRDFVGIKMWLSETEGFSPDDETNLVHDIGEDRSFTVAGLDQDTTYYFVYQAFDAFGEGEVSGELSLETKAGLDLEGLSGWAYEIDPADREFIETNLAADAVPSEKIVNLTAAKITTGTLNATETITSEGLIRAVDDVNTPDLQVGIGPANIDSSTYLLWAHNDAQGLIFGVDEFGNATFNGDGTFGGDLSAAGGTFTGTLSAVDGDFSGEVTADTFFTGDINNSYVEFDGTNLTIAVDRLGSGASNAGANSVALGGGSSAGGDNTITVGVDALSERDRSISIGYNASCPLNNNLSETSSISIGDSSTCSGFESVSLGANSSSTSRSVAIGGGAFGKGPGAVASGAWSVSIGHSSEASSIYSTSLGSESNASGGNSTALGAFSNASHENSVAIGYNATTQSNNQIRLGRSSETVSVPGDIDCGSDGNIDNNLTVGGNITASGTITQSSDERKKTNWQDLSEDFLDNLSNVKYGTFDRTDKELTQAGVSANDWQKVLPESVGEDAEGFLTMDYGSSALVTCLKLAKEVRQLKEEIAKLKGEK